MPIALTLITLGLLSLATENDVDGFLDLDIELLRCETYGMVWPLAVNSARGLMSFCVSTTKQSAIACAFYNVSDRLLGVTGLRRSETTPAQQPWLRPTPARRAVPGPRSSARRQFTSNQNIYDRTACSEIACL